MTAAQEQNEFQNLPLEVLLFLFLKSLAKASLSFGIADPAGTAITDPLRPAEWNGCRCMSGQWIDRHNRGSGKDDMLSSIKYHLSGINLRDVLDTQTLLRVCRKND